MQEAKAYIVTLFAQYGIQILGVLFILVLGFFIAVWAGRLLLKTLEKKGMEPPLRLSLVRLTRLLIVGFAIIIAFEKFGVSIASVIAGGFGVQIFGALGILAFGFFVATWVGRWMTSALEKKGMEPPLRFLLIRVARLLIIGFTTVIALEKFGVPVASLIAGIGVAGVGIGLATQGVLGNLVAGLVIIFTKPFRVGEYIELLGVNGQVTSIELFSTTLAHPDRSRVVVPNRRIVGEILHNYGQIRQALLTVSVSYEADLPRAISLLQSVAQSNPRVLKDPAPGVGIGKLGDSFITISIQPWASLADFGPVQTELYQAIVERFREARIEVPAPKQDIRILEKAV